MSTESTSNLSDPESQKKTKRELRLGDRVLVTSSLFTQHTFPTSKKRRRSTECAALCSIFSLSTSTRPFFFCRLVGQRPEWFGFWERRTLPRESGVEWNWMNLSARTTVPWQGPGKGDRTGVSGSGSGLGFEPVPPCSSQILPVHAQVWPLRSSPQGDPHWLPLHHPHQDQGFAEEVSPQEEPQCVLHELAQLCQLLIQWQTKPSRSGEPPPSDYGRFVADKGITIANQIFPADGDVGSLRP